MVIHRAAALISHRARFIVRICILSQGRSHNSPLKRLSGAHSAGAGGAAMALGRDAGAGAGDVGRDDELAALGRATFRG